MLNKKMVYLGAYACGIPSFLKGRIKYYFYPVYYQRRGSNDSSSMPHISSSIQNRKKFFKNRMIFPEQIFSLMISCVCPDSVIY